MADNSSATYGVTVGELSDWLSKLDRDMIVNALHLKMLLSQVVGYEDRPLLKIDDMFSITDGRCVVKPLQY